MIIRRLPSSFVGFFQPMPPSVSKPQYAHLWTPVLGFLVNLRAAKLVHVARVGTRSTQRTRHGAFPSQAEVEVAAKLRTLQCVACFGVVSSVRVNTASTCSSVSFRKAPARGSSPRPSRRSRLGRERGPAVHKPAPLKVATRVAHASGIPPGGGLKSSS